MRDDVLGFRSEADEQRPAAFRQPALAEFGEDVRGFSELERQRLARFRDLLRRACHGHVVGHGRGHHHEVHVVCAREHRLMHVGGAADVDNLSHGRLLDRRRPGDQRYLRPAPRRFRGDRIPHAAARSVADVAHGIEIFVGRTGGDEDPSAAKRTLGPQDRLRGGDDLVGLGEASLADPSARQIALARLDEARPARRQRIEVLPHRLVREHLRIHRRCDQQRRARRGIERRQEIVGDAVGELADDVGGGRRDQQQINRGRDRDVLDVGVHAVLELIGNHFSPGNRFERHRPDEPGRRVRHHRHDLVSALLQAARDLHGLVGANATRHAERDQSHNPITRPPDYPITRWAARPVRALRPAW